MNKHEIKYFSKRANDATSRICAFATTIGKQYMQHKQDLWPIIFVALLFLIIGYIFIAPAINISKRQIPFRTMAIFQIVGDIFLSTETIPFNKLKPHIASVLIENGFQECKEDCPSVLAKIFYKRNDFLSFDDIIFMRIYPRPKAFVLKRINNDLMSEFVFSNIELTEVFKNSKFLSEWEIIAFR